LFEIKDQDLAARIGKLYTRRGVIETPHLFPVIDPSPRKQVVDPRTIASIGFSALITNAYLALRRVGRGKDLHSVIGFDGPLMTDSGAYQLMQYGEVDVTNREIVEYQRECGSDIAVILDIPTRAEDPRHRVVESVEETLRRANEVLDIVEGSDILWVLPIQGGHYLDVLQYSARMATRIPGYSIYGLGSPTTFLERFELDKIVDMIAVVRLTVPFSMPIHLFGAGHPLAIPFAVALGVDTMDSASYILYARDDRYMTPSGTYRLQDLDYLPCSCPVCQRRDPRDLLEMERSERCRLLALHNLYALIEEVRRVKQAIREGRLWEYLEEVSHRHPAARRALERVLHWYSLIERHAPRYKGEARAVMLKSSLSLYNPRLIHARRAAERMRIAPGSIDLYMVPLYTKPDPSDIGSLVRSLGIPEEGAVHLYHPFLGVFPLGLYGRYPYSQFELGALLEDEIVEDLALEIAERWIEADQRSARVKIVCCEDVDWSRRVCAKLREMSSEMGVEADFIRVAACRRVYM